MEGEQWRTTLNGYYSSFGESDQNRFQTRTNIALSGKSWRRGGQRIVAGKPTQVDLREGNGMWESAVAIPVEDLLVEQFEQSRARERRITKAALAELEREFAALTANPTWDAAVKLLPDGTRVRGKPSIALDASFQGGLYNARIRCNPGEPGKIHLRAFEITRNHPLSVDRLRTATNEWVGWSADHEEQFLSETHFTIYEGDWEQFYGARFEVWFDPDRGGPARKLLEENFKIEGWMR
jgi:hypothetical protein